MTLKVEATFENGVFVPAQRPALADHQRVRLTIETEARSSIGADAVRRRRGRRIRLDATLAKDIASSPEFRPDES